MATHSEVHPLVELSSCAYPEKLQHPKARQAVLKVSQLLRAVLPPGRWPFPYQIVGIAYGYLAKFRCLIADDMGLGKTPQALCLLAILKPTCSIVIATTSTLRNWEREAAGWVPGVRVVVLDSEKARCPSPGFNGIVITTWDLLRSAHLPALLRLRAQLLIGDEAHAVKNPETARHQAFVQLADASPHRLILTGTPIENVSAELWHLLHILDARAWPEVLLPSFEVMDKDEIDAGHQTRLQTRIRQYMLRRLKHEVPTNIPDKAHRDIFIDMTPEQKAEYDRLHKSFESWLERHLQAKVEQETEALGRPARPADLAHIRLKVERAMKHEQFAKIGYLRRFVGPIKVPAAVQWAVDLVRAGEPCVIFFEHQEVYRLLQEGLQARGVAFGAIVGETSSKERQRVIDGFQSRKFPVLLCSQAGREGITAHAARHVLQLERWWTPSREGQAGDRVHRIGQKREVTLWRMHLKGTIDTRMAEINAKKRKITARVVGAS